MYRGARSIVHDLWANGNGKILLAVGTGWFLSIGIRFVFPPLLPFFRGTFQIDLISAGLILSILWVGYAIGQFPGGVLGDRYGERNILVLSTAISAIAVLMIAVSVSVWALFIGVMLFGFTTALYGPTRYTIFTDIYGRHDGVAVGITRALGSIGNTILPIVAVSIATYATWRLSYGLFVPLLLGTTVLLWFVVPKRTSTVDDPIEPLSMVSLRRIIASVSLGGIPIVVAIHVLVGFISQGFIGFYPIYLIQVKDFSPEMASLLFGLFFAFGVLIQPVVGFSKDRFGSSLTLFVIIVLFLTGLLTLQIAETIFHVALITLFLSYYSGVGVITNTFIANALPDNVKGSGLGFLRSSWILVGASSPLFVGYLGDLGALSMAYFVLAGLAGIAAVLSLFIPKGGNEEVLV